MSLGRVLILEAVTSCRLHFSQTLGVLVVGRSNGEVCTVLIRQAPRMKECNSKHRMRKCTTAQLEGCHSCGSTCSESVAIREAAGADIE